MQVMLADLIAYFAIVLPCYARISTNENAFIWWSNMGKFLGFLYLSPHGPAENIYSDRSKKVFCAN